MKQLISSKTVVLVMALIALAWAVAPGFAETPKLLRASVPFPFLLGDQTLPAGEYIVRLDTLRHIIFEQVDTTRVFATYLTVKTPERTGNLTHGILQFNVYGNVRILAKLWRPGQNEGSEVRMSKKAQEFARLYGEPEVLVSALSPR